MDKIDWVAVIIALVMISPVISSFIGGIYDKFFGGNRQHNPDL